MAFLATLEPTRLSLPKGALEILKKELIGLFVIEVKQNNNNDDDDNNNNDNDNDNDNNNNNNNNTIIELG